MDRKMKASGIEWIVEIPKNWEVDRIKHIFKSGKGLSITKENLIDNGLAVVSYGQIHSKTNTGVTIEKDLLRFVDFKYQKYYPQCQVYRYDFIFADTSEDYEGCGNCVYKRDDSILFAGYHSIILHSIKQQDNRYLAYLFKTDCWRKQIREVASGVKLFTISQKALINSSVIIPPFEIQQSIADYLDKKCAEIDALLSDIQSQIDILEDYKKSVITETVTKGLNPNVEMKDSGIEWIGKIPKDWEYKKLKYIIEGQLLYGANESGIDFDESYPRYIRITDIDENSNLKETGKLSLSPEMAKSYLLCDEDILFARSGATVGKTFLYQEKYGKAAFAGYLIKATINKSIVLPKYVYYSTLGTGYENWKTSVFTQATIQNIGADKYALYQVPVPSIIEQDEIVKYLDVRCEEINNAIDEKKEQLETLEQYKKSLIYEYVTGKREVPYNNG